MAVFGTDEAYWWDQGIFGQLGYAVPNFGNDPYTLNQPIHTFFCSMGRILQDFMHHADADRSDAPSINTIRRVKMGIERGRDLLADRAVPASQMRFEPQHVMPARMAFRVFPTPYFRVLNRYMKEACGLILAAMSEAAQSTENRAAYEISNEFAGMIGQYLRRVYKLWGTELLKIPRESFDGEAGLSFTWPEDALKAYNPAASIPSAERTSVVPNLDLIPTEDDIAFITAGIDAPMLVGAKRWPVGELPSADGGPTSADASGTGGSSSGTFVAAPGEL